MRTPTYSTSGVLRGVAGALCVGISKREDGCAAEGEEDERSTDDEDEDWG
jgi:hypothetical protein